MYVGPVGADPGPLFPSLATGRARFLRDEADTMDRAAVILKLRASRPRSIVVNGICGLLRQGARQIRAEAAAIERRAA